MKARLRPAVMAVFVNSENKVLIGSSPRDGGYKFPQGGLDEGETPLEGIKREMKEELGIELKDKDIIEQYEEKVSYYFSNPNREDGLLGQQQTVFKIKYEEDMDLIPQDNEFDKLIWIHPNEKEKYSSKHRNKAYKRALEICGLL